MILQEKFSNKDKKLEILLVDYQKRQDSAEHNNYMGWLVSSIFIFASISLFGVLLKSINEIDNLLIFYGSIIGILLSLSDIIIFDKSHYYKIKNYEILDNLRKRLKGEFDYEIPPHGGGRYFSISYLFGFAIKLLLIIGFFLILYQCLT